VEKRALALKLRKAGKTYKQIAEEIPCSLKSAYLYVKQAIAEVSAKNVETTQDIIDLEVQRLDSMLLSMQDNLESGHVTYIDRALKIMERRAKLLGLDKPVKVAPTTPDGDQQYHPENIRAKIMELIDRKE